MEPWPRTFSRRKCSRRERFGIKYCCQRFCEYGEDRSQSHCGDLTVVDIENEQPFSGTWRVDDIQLQFCCMFPDFSKVPLVVEVCGSRNGIDGKVDIEVIDNVRQVQEFYTTVTRIRNLISI